MNAALRHVLSIIALVAALVSASFAGKNKEFQSPNVSSAATYAAHDAHTNEKVTIAGDPYNTAAKTEIFRMKYLDKGILPVNLIITNESGQALALTDMRVQLVSRERHAKLSPMGDQDIFRRMTKAKRSDDVARTSAPLPFPTRRKVGGLKQEDQDEVERAMFQAKAVEPGKTQSGFVFFDVGDLENPLDGAVLYVTGVLDGRGSELMYFEVPMDRAK